MPERQLRAIAVGVALLTTASAVASEPVASIPTTRRVVVIPVMDYGRRESELFEAEAAEQAKAREQRVHQYLSARLGVEQNIEVINLAAVRERLQQRFRVQYSQAANYFDLGRAEYESLQIRDATIIKLEKAFELYESGFHHVVDPSALSNAALLLARASVERKSSDAQKWLNHMFRYTPWRVFERGFYSGPLEAELKSALVNFRATYPKDRPVSAGALDSFMEAADVDVVVYAWLSRPDDSTEVLHLHLYDRFSRDATYSLSYPVDRWGDGQLQVDRAASAWSTCLPTESAPAVRRSLLRNALFIDAGFAYSLYAQDTTRRPFHNLGMALSAEYQFLAGLGAFVQVNMFTSTLDPDRDLVDSVTNVRTLLGVSYAFRDDWWRVYVRIGFDLHFLGSYATTTDPWCKWRGKGDNRCTGGVTDLGDEITFGFHGGFGVQFFFNRNVYAAVRVSTSSYIVPLDDTILVNFPVNGELSLGYGF